MRLIYKRRMFSILVLFFAFSLIPALRASQGWEKPAQPPAAGELLSLLPHPVDGERLIVASEHEVLEKLQNNNWKNLWTLQGPSRIIQRLVSVKEFPETLFVLTKDGAWKGNLQTHEWTEIYHGRTKAEKSALAFSVSPEDKNHWFLGTESGLFESDDAGKTWFRFTHFGAKPIPVLRLIHQKLFIVAANELFVSEDFAHFRIIFALPKISSELEELGDAASEDEESRTNPNRELFDLTSSQKSSVLWLATKRGVFESNDSAIWLELPRSGLRSSEIRHLVYDENTERLFAGTPKGIYVYRSSSKRWEEIHRGLDQPDTKGLTILPGKNPVLAAVTGSGFVYYPLLPDLVGSPAAEIFTPGDTELFQKLIQMEPSAREIHRAVVRYNNVGNGKIKRWHAGSRLASLVPSFSFGKSFYSNSNVDLDRGGTNDPDRFINGPLDTHHAWDASARWDIANLIWSSNQTSIDSREKLMVELRNDLLAEATRIYFERRRLQMEIIYSPTSSEEEHFEKLLRLDEMTALLDGMTNGLMSKALEKMYAAHPELKAVWTMRGEARSKEAERQEAKKEKEL